MRAQLVLTAVVAVCSHSRRPLAWRIGIWVGVVNSALILGHVVLSVATAE